MLHIGDLCAAPHPEFDYSQSLMKKLTPTSYALLGLLARGPWSAYELNFYMQSSVLNAFWPRAASHVYSEPKKLVELKLATARAEERNGRQRTVYKITAAGHKALESWLGSSTESYVTMSFEAMLKFLYAASGDRQSLEANLNAIEESALSAVRSVLEGVRPMVAEQTASMEGMPYNGMALNFLADVMEAQLNWAREAKQVLAELDETTLTEQSRQVGIQSYKQLISRLEKIAGESGGN